MSQKIILKVHKPRKLAQRSRGALIEHHCLKIITYFKYVSYKDAYLNGVGAYSTNFKTVLSASSMSLAENKHLLKLLHIQSKYSKGARSIKIG